MKKIQQSTKSPNQALQRTAPAVTMAASGLRLAPNAQPARQPPQSLSLLSLGKPKWHQVCPHVTKKMPQLNKNYGCMPYMQHNRW